MHTKLAIAISFAIASSQALAAGNTRFDEFVPMSASVTPAVALGLEATAGMTLAAPSGTHQFTFKSIADGATQDSQPANGVDSGNWDMIDTNRTGPDAGRYLFMPFETGAAGVLRIDTQDANPLTRSVTIVAPGTQGFVAGDASRWTPWGSYLTAEESWGASSTKGRLFEVTNPTTAGVNSGNMVARSIVPRVSHEGLAFDNANSLYFVDELNGGSLYKYVSVNPTASVGSNGLTGFFDAGQTFALKVGAGGNNEGNAGAAITGASTWVAITDLNGAALAGLSVLAADGTIDGRLTADVVGIAATGYNRPEDIELQTLSGGDQLLYFATTDVDNGPVGNLGDGRVYNLNLTTGVVGLFADANTINLATGLALGNQFKNPDNIAIDADGNMYIIEDRNGGVDDDIWMAKDLNKDGDLLDVGEGLARWASNGVAGSEFTGLYFDVFNGDRAYVNIQHPNSGVDRTFEINAVPVPAALPLLASALGGLGVASRRRKSK